MSGAFNCVKVASNAIVLKLEADDKFLEYLKNSVKKSFAGAIIMKRSIFIMPKEGERHRRKVFLTWAANLLSRELQSSKKHLEGLMFNSCDMPINIQIAPKKEIVSIKRAYAYFEDDSIAVRCYAKGAPLFSYLNVALQSGCKVEIAPYEIRFANIEARVISIFRSIFSRKLSLGFDSYEILYSKRDFEKFAEERRTVCGYDARACVKNRMLTILGLDDSSSTEHVKKRYFELAKKYHPDLHSSKSDTERNAMLKKFLQIKEAYEILKAS